MVHKKDVISALKLTADILELLGENEFKIQSYRSLARQLEYVDSPSQISSPPKGAKFLLPLIEDFMQTGVFSPLEDASSKVPAGVLSLFGVRGLGAKKVRLLWDSGIESLEDLYTACQNNVLQTLSGFGAKSQQNVLESVEFVLAHQNELHLNTAWRITEDIMQRLQAFSPKVVGALARGFETAKWLKFTTTATAEDIHTALTPIATDVEQLDQGIRCKIHGVTVKVGYSTPETRGALDILYMGGNSYKENLHHAAQHKNLSLDLSGLTREGTIIPAATELDVLERLGLPYTPPEYRDREHEGLLLATETELITVADMRGMLHVHSHYSDGVPSIKELANEVQRLGFGYLGMGDHSVSAFYAKGLSPERLRQQMQEIDALQGEGFCILKGSEVDILEDGSLDYPDELLAELDYVVASVHSQFQLPSTKQTERLIKAVSHPLVTILGHPTGRLLLRRPRYHFDLDAVLQAASECHTVIEINANPYRLDLDWREALKWRGRLKFAINTDAHVLAGLEDVRYGVAVARKAGLTAHDVVNTLDYQEFQTFVQHTRALR